MILSEKYRSSKVVCMGIFICMITSGLNGFAQYSPKDTLVMQAVIFNGDTLEAKILEPVYFYSHLKNSQLSAKAKWTRLRNAVYVTYPYAKRAGAVLNDISARMVNMIDNSVRKAYIRTREKELKKEFTDPLTNLSIYQGRVLMKLINRETGNNCYEIIKEYKGGLVARFYQTIAFFFDTSLKQPYNPKGDDGEIEKIVQEVQRMYGYRS